LFPMGQRPPFAPPSVTARYPAIASTNAAGQAQRRGAEPSWFVRPSALPVLTACRACTSD
jgi:hypothetical protein